jgi:hypothetical protein
MAVNKNPNNIHYVDNQYPKYNELAEMAVKKDPSSLIYVSFDYPDYKKAVKIAARKRLSILGCICPVKSEEILNEIVRDRVKEIILKIKSLPPRDNRGRFIKKNNSSKRTTIKI